MSAELERSGLEERVNELLARQEAYLATAPAKRTVGYFSAEFGIHECLPIYSGGLGVLAGDHIKAASDLNVPLVAVGLIYRRGYFRQHIDAEGRQQEEYPELHPAERGIRLAQDATGQPLQVTIPVDGRQIHIRVWRADVGRVPLLLLDTDIEGNEEVDRWITSHLYGGDRDTRIKQEIVLGMGGFRVLAALGYNDIQTYHLNEGHAAFLCLEAIRQNRLAGESFEWARAKAAGNIVFTTHTPVAAGHDTFAPELMGKYLGQYAGAELRCDFGQLMQLGGARPGVPGFSMTELALNVSRAANGVSARHGIVSRALFPGRPIDSITNGVHHLTWTSPVTRRLFDDCLPGWRERPDRLAEAEDIPDAALERAHQENKDLLMAHLNTVQQRVEFDPAHLTLGFARRFATYKRAGLLFSDLARLSKLAKRGLQLIVAGKAHPQDEDGKRLIQEVVRLCEEQHINATFVEDYDLRLGRLLTAGVDVWLNTPRRPLEASGTSGMKATLNGVPNLSVLDGWWVEGYDGTNGWAIGPDEEALNSTTRDEDDAADLYHLLEQSLIPEFYEGRGPWLQRMKRAIATSAQFTSHRMVTDYSRRYYRL